MSKNELSSVEFYAKAEKDLSDRFSLRQVNYTQYREKKRELLEQAKAMHKEEIIVSVKYGFNKEYYTPNYREQQELFEQYYNETFGGNNEQQ